MQILNRDTLRSSSCLAVSSAFGLALIAWSGTHIYVVMCAPSGIYGFFQSMITMDSTPCQALFSIVNHTQKLYAGTIASLLFAFLAFIGSCVPDKKS